MSGVSPPSGVTQSGVDEPRTGFPDVFISYGSDDVALARELRGHLESGGYSCWMAPDDVSGPKTWAEQIVDAIAGCQVVLVLVSAVSNQSTHVSKEVDLALDHGKAILPVRVEDVAPTGALRYLLALAQWIDVFPGPLGPHAEEVRQRVAAIVEASGGHRPEEAALSPTARAPAPRQPRVQPRLVRWVRSHRWWLVGGLVGVALASMVAYGITNDWFGDDTPTEYGDDARLDRLLDRCGSGDMGACDTLLGEALEGTEYWNFAFTCGERLDGGGDCLTRVDLPSEYGDSPHLDELFDACNGGDLAACDELAQAAPLATPYWEFGDSCGGRQPRGGGGCTEIAADGQPFTYGDDPWLDELWDGCNGEDFGACQMLYEEAPVGSEYEWFGGSCGGRLDSAEGCSLAGAPDVALEGLAQECDSGELLACDHLREEAPAGSDLAQFAATCGGRREPGPPCAFTRGDSFILDELWAGCEEGQMDACNALYFEAPVDSEYEVFGFTCGYRTDGGIPCGEG